MPTWLNGIFVLSALPAEERVVSIERIALLAAERGFPAAGFAGSGEVYVASAETLTGVQSRTDLRVVLQLLYMEMSNIPPHTMGFHIKSCRAIPLNSPYCYVCCCELGCYAVGCY